MLEGRSRSFLVGLTPNQDVYDANIHPERLYGVYTSVWEGMEGSRGVQGPYHDPLQSMLTWHHLVMVWHLDPPKPR